MRTEEGVLGAGGWKNVVGIAADERQFEVELFDQLGWHQAEQISAGRRSELWRAAKGVLGPARATDRLALLEDGHFKPGAREQNARHQAVVPRAQNNDMSHSRAPMLAITPRIPWKLILSIGAIPAIVAVVQLGRIHPDEVYQWLEPSFYRAHGYGVLSWEWSQGIRNWAIPIVFGWLLKACAAIGISNPRIYRALLEAPQYLLHLAMLFSFFRSCDRLLRGQLAPRPTALFALCAPVVVFAGRTMGESFSAAFLIIALGALDRPLSKSAAVFGGPLLGLAVVAPHAARVAAPAP